METKILKVSGMVCTHCANRLEKAFYENAKVEKVEADFLTDTVKLTSSLNTKEIKDIISDSGFSLND